MTKKVDVVLDGTTYSIPALNLGQIEEVSPIITQGGPLSAFKILRIAMQRATPKPDLETLAVDFDEVRVAVQEILGMAGLKKADENPPTPLVLVKP